MTDRNVAIAYNNLLETADDITATGEAQGFEVANIIDWRTNTAWKSVAGSINEIIGTWPGAGVEVNAFGFFHHNLNDFGGANVALSYWDGGGWQPASDLQILPIAGTYLRATYGNLGQWNQWRFRITTTVGDVPTVGHLFMGDLLRAKSQKPLFGPAVYNDNSRFRTELSENGQFMGRTFEVTGNRTSIGLDLLSPTETENDLLPWINHAKYLPFYYSWDFENHPDEAAYCWTRRPITAQYYRTPQFMRLRADLEARID